MKKIILIYALCLLAGCSRVDYICYEPNHPHAAPVKLTTHWPKIFTGDDAVKTDSIYLHLFDQQGAYLSGQTARDQISLVPGTYYALATNRYLPQAELRYLDDMYQTQAGNTLATRADQQQTPLYNQAVNLYAAWSEAFEITDDPEERELSLTFYQRSIKIRLHVTVEGLEHVASISTVLRGMAESVSLVSGHSQGNCRVSPSITPLPTGYRLDAALWGASPLSGQEIEITLTLMDGTLYTVVSDLTDVFLTLTSGEYEADVYITLSVKQGVEFEAKINGWQVGNVLYGDIK